LETVIVVATEVADVKLESAAFVAVIEHDPLAVVTSAPLLIEHPAVPALTTANDIAPVPDPPLAASARLTPAMAVMVEMTTGDDWLMRLNVTVVSADADAS
jgi:hypothetical protein